MWAKVENANGNIRGALWMVGAAMFFATMNGIIRMLGTSLHGFEIAFFRSLFGVAFLVPMVLAAGGPAILRTRRYGLHGLRAAFGTTTMLLSFYAFTQLPLANATTLTFSSPLFLLALAPLVLGETVGWHRRIAAAVGFVGVLIAAQPETQGFNLASAAMLTAAFSMACAMICVKSLSRTDHPLAILSIFSVIAVFVTFGPAVAVWRAPSLLELAWMVVAAGLGTGGQYCYIRSYRIGDASLVAPFNFLQLPFAAAIGVLAFGESPGMATLVGGLIIAASGLYIMHREAVVHRRTPMPPAPL